jgi:uncharacterized protein (DUF697 family)
MANPFLDYFLKNAVPGSMTKKDKAQEVVRAHVLWGLGAGIIPVPVLDIAAVTAVQMDMISQLCKIYRINYQANLGKGVVSSLVGSTLARVGASFVKAIPVVGTLIGGASMAVLSGASTYAVGQVFITHFERGGNLEDFDVNAYRAAYDEQFKVGREVAQEMEQKKGAESGDAFRKLERLNQLKERGIITEEEFQAKKAEILREL